MNTSYEREFAPLLRPGTRIKGKWRGTVYQVERQLGEGANGKVYMVSRKGQMFAMKLGRDAADLQSEINALQALTTHKGSYQGFFVEADDVVAQDGQTYPFYVMKYVKGLQLQDYIARHGRDWFPLIGLRLLEKLRELHDHGWIFGDLKKENVLISGHGEVELVDFGGMTPIGRAVKQFTELYDRGTWGGGSRRADPAYDRFSFAVLAVEMLGEPRGSFTKQGLPQNRTVDDLWDEVKEEKALSAYLPFLKRAFGVGGEGFSDDKEASRSWRELVQSGRGVLPGGSGRVGSRGGGALRFPYRKGKAEAVWLPAGFMISLLFLLWVLFYYR